LWFISGEGWDALTSIVHTKNSPFSAPYSPATLELMPTVPAPSAVLVFPHPQWSSYHSPCN